MDFNLPYMLTRNKNASYVLATKMNECIIEPKHKGYIEYGLTYGHDCKRRYQDWSCSFHE